MAHNSDGAPEAENNRQSAQARSQNAAARGSADRRECCPAPLPTARRSCSSSRLAHSRLALVPEEAAAGFSFWRVHMPQRTRPWAVPRITCRHCRARTGPAGRTSPGEKQIKRPASDYASPFARRPGIGQLAARAPARQQARRPSLTRIAPPVVGSCSACTGTAGRAGTRGISHGPQVRTGHTSRSSPPLSAR